MSKKSIFVILFVIAMVFISTIFLNNVSTFGLKGSVNDVIPSNPAFDDIYFYSSVVRAYYEEKEDEFLNDDIYEFAYDINKKLTDDDLKEVKELHIENANSLKGLNKLTELESLSIYYYDGSIDLSGLDKLRSLRIENSNISSITINNSNLESLELSRTSFDNLDLSNTVISYINNSKSKINSISFPNSVENIILDDAGLRSISFANDSQNIQSISLKNNKLSEIDLSGMSNLYSLNISNNNLTSIDISDCTNLQMLNLNNNEIENLNISNNRSLYSLSFLDTKIKNLDISDNDSIKDFNQNSLNSIKLNNNSYIYRFGNKGNIREINVTDGMYFKINSDDIKIINNNLVIKNTMTISEFLQNVSINSDTIICFSTDCSNEEYNLNNTIYDNSNVHIYSINGGYDVWLGVNVFNDSSFDNFDFYIQLLGRSGISDDDLSNIEYLYLNINYDNYSLKGIEKLTNLKNISLYSDGRYNVDNLDLSNLNNLEDITFDNIGLEEKDLVINNNSNLRSISISNTNLENIKLQGNSALQNVRIYDNFDLKKLKLSGDELSNVEISNNKKLNDVSLDSINLESLNIYGNNITELDTSNISSLKRLDADDNKISSLNLDSLENLTHLEIENNNIKSLNLSNLANLTNLEISGNPLQELVFNGQSIDDLSLYNVPELREIRGFETLKELEEMQIFNSSIEELNVSNLNKLESLVVSFSNLKRINGINDLKNLKSLGLSYNSIEKLDLSNLDLLMTGLSHAPYENQEIYMLKGTTVNYKPNLVLPNSISARRYNEDDSIVKFEKNKITAKKVGESAITTFIPDYFEIFGLEEPYELPIRMYVKVFDIYSQKYEINKEKKYVFVGNEPNDKAIKRYVKSKGLDSRLVFNNNTVDIYLGEDLFDTFKIIKLLSNKIDLNGNTIYYRKMEDVEDIEVINAYKVILNNQLQVKLKDGTIIKTYDLRKENS